MVNQNLKKMGPRVEGVVFCLDDPISLSICGRSLEFFLFITLFLCD